MPPIRIYYGDGSVVELEEGVNPPARDVQIIIQEHPKVGWHTQSGSDYYVFRDGRYVGVDIFGLFDWLIEKEGVLFGRTMITREFNELMKKALKDLDGKKNGWMKDERKPI